MSYDPNPYRPVRDYAHPSQIAAQRPALATRIHCCCDDPLDGGRASSIRGDQGEMDYESGRREFTEDRVAEFNRGLRAGHAYRNDGEE
jgi:hypothetical protein